MRTVEKITLFLILINFCSCKQNTPETEKIVIKKEISKSEKDRLEKRRINAENEKKDSLSFAKVLENSLSIAKQNIDKKSFKNELKPISDYELGSVTSSIEIGNFFSKSQKYLLVRTKTSSNVYIDIFLIKNQSFLPVLSHKEWAMTYVKDTIQDVNGDGQKDFLVNWYGSSGCCLKNFYNVYLFQTDKIEFSKSFEFINPTFFPKEKLIRGVCYGQPGETEMYKYKWNEKNIDTIEYISYEKDFEGIKTGKIIQSSEINYTKPKAKFKKLNEIPKEYKLIYGYDWFIGKV
ncbi:XAC2610-related protein [Flavobacterium sp.]